MTNFLRLCALLLLGGVAQAQNQAPQLSNVQPWIEADVGEYSYVLFDVSDAENDSIIISLAYSNDNGVTYQPFPDDTDLSGDIGHPIAPGTNKYIGINNIGISANVFLKITAHDRQAVDIQAIVDSVDIERVMADMAFVEGTRHYSANPNHIAAIKDTIYNRFEAANLNVVRQAFTVGSFTDAENIVGTQTGNGLEQDVVIVDAHFDTVDDAPGADDNGTGVLGLLETMRVLAPYHFERSLQYIGFDLEELGLLGSLNFVANDIPAQNNIVGVLNYEMIGYYTEEPNTQAVPAGFNILYPDLYAQLQANEFRGDFLINIANIDSNPLRMLFDSCAAAYVPALKVMSLAIPGNGEIAPDFRRSDHAPFWDTDRQALMLTDGANFRNPYYHTPNDLALSVNYDFLVNNIKATVATAATLAHPLHATVVTAPFVPQSGISNTPTTGCRLHASPNPAKEHLHVSWADCTAKQMPQYLMLHDSNGKQVRRVVPALGSNSLDIDIVGLPQGIYYLSTSVAQQRQTVVIQP